MFSVYTTAEKCQNAAISHFGFGENLRRKLGNHMISTMSSSLSSSILLLFISQSRSPLQSDYLFGSERWPHWIKADTDWNSWRRLWTYKGGMEAFLLGEHETNILLGNEILLTRASVWFGIVLLWTCYCDMRMLIDNAFNLFS